MIKSGVGNLHSKQSSVADEETTWGGDEAARQADSMCHEGRNVDEMYGIKGYVDPFLFDEPRCKQDDCEYRTIDKFSVEFALSRHLRRGTIKLTPLNRIVS